MFRTWAVGKSALVGLGLAAGSIGVGLTVTGFGALGALLIAIILGGAHHFYKERHTIQNKFQTWKSEIEEKKIDRKIKEFKREEIENTCFLDKNKKFYDYTVKEEMNNKLVDNIDNYYREKIDPILNKINPLESKLLVLKTESEELEKIANPAKKIFKRFINFSKRKFIAIQIRPWKQKIQELANEKTSIALGRSRVQIQCFKVIKKSEIEMPLIKKCLNGTQNELNSVKLKRQKINEKFRYGKDIAKFASDENGNPMDIQNLELIHDSICIEGFNSQKNIEILKKFFWEQNIRTGSLIHIEQLQEGMDETTFWTFLINGITTPLK